MARRDSLGAVFKQVIGKRVQSTAYAKTLAIMKDFADEVIKAFKSNREFYNITGNAYTSFTVGVFYKGSLVHIASVSDDEDEPTRATLREGEAYNLLEYYDGGAAEPPYEGKTGHGGQWGPTLGPYRVRRERGRVRDTWSVVCVCPVEYATYNKRIYDTMTQTMLDFPSLFSASVLYVRHQSIGEIERQ